MSILSDDGFVESILKKHYKYLLSIVKTVYEKEYLVFHALKNSTQLS